MGNFNKFFEYNVVMDEKGNMKNKVNTNMSSLLVLSLLELQKQRIIDKILKRDKNLLDVTSKGDIKDE